MDRKGF